MASDFFDFKQFRVYHDQCAMKVGTDSVLLGTWCPSAEYDRVLDVGGGSGVISLILAQRFPQIQKVDVVELDKLASAQAKHNFDISPWREKFEVFSIDFNHFETEHLYDLIISNPPYFEVQSSASPIETRHIARNQESLSLKSLLNKSKKLLSNQGSIILVLPYTNLLELETASDLMNLFINKMCFVYSKKGKKCERILVVLNKYKDEIRFESELVLMEGQGRHDYTPEFISLAKEFYTIF